MNRFRLLVVEDEPVTLDQLKKLLAKAVPEAVIEEAAWVHAALERIDKALQEGIVYDLAILDFKLPQTQGGDEAVDVSICERLRRSMPDIVICHISAYMDNETVRKHILADHTADQMRGFALAKLEPEFASELVRNVRESLYGPRLKVEIADVMRQVSGRGASFDLLRFGAPSRQPSLTTRLMSLPIDIGRYWDFLNSDTQSYILRFYTVSSREGTPLDEPVKYAVRPR